MPTGTCQKAAALSLNGKLQLLHPLTRLCKPMDSLPRKEGLSIGSVSGAAEAGGAPSLGRAGWGGDGASNCAPRRANTPVDGNERAPGLAASPLCENKYIQSPPLA
ncbi:hypothetical protein AOLI_G00056920 [Acnodon oligacanthus]